VRTEPKTIRTAGVEASRLLHYHDGAVKVTTSAFYSSRIAVGKPIATSFL